MRSKYNMKVVQIIIFLLVVLLIIILIAKINNNMDNFDPSQRLSRFVMTNQNCNGSKHESSLNEYANLCESRVLNKINIYDDQYIDTDQFAGYNTLLDDETKKYYRNFNNFPLTNGPPRTDILYYIQ